VSRSHATVIACAVTATASTRVRDAGPGPGASPRRRTMVILATLLVGAIVATVHGPVLRAQARSLDDAQFVTYNPLVTHPGWASTRRFFGEVLKPSTVKGYYLPLSMTSLMLDYAMGGRSENLFVFHRTSLALHALASHSGLTAHVRDVRGWAVAGPLLIVAAVVNVARPRR